jgi:hypothetical protein
VLRPLRQFGPPDADEVRVMPYVELQRSSDGGFPLGRHHYWKAGFLKQLPTAAIDVILGSIEHAPCGTRASGCSR